MGSDAAPVNKVLAVWLEPGAGLAHAIDGIARLVNVDALLCDSARQAEEEQYPPQLNSPRLEPDGPFH